MPHYNVVLYIATIHVLLIIDYCKMNSVFSDCMFHTCEASTGH